MNNKKKIILIIIPIVLVAVVLSIVITKPNVRKLLGSVNLMNLQAVDVPYTNNSQSNVKSALDDLYSKTGNLECKMGYEKQNETSAGYECVIPPICKKASTLHTETCNQSSNYCAAVEGNGNTVTYGQIPTGDTYQSGDAFDCDVNGDGTYDSATERFYYVSDYYDTSTNEINSDYAVLIYYSDVKNGVASPGFTVAYESSNKNYIGPERAKLQLPTTSQWSNVSLYKDTRQILTQTGTTSTSGGTLPTAYSYSGYAARLITAQEINKGCNITIGSYTTGELDNCKYLMENTKYTTSSYSSYGPWLETPRASSSRLVWDVYAFYRSVDNSDANNSYSRGTRPAIEVLKSRISR